LAKGDAAGAVAAFGQAAEAAPKDPVAAEAHLAQGRTLEALAKREEALRAYAQVIERFPQTAWAQQANERTAGLR
jgi:TolA-binding protein